MAGAARRNVRPEEILAFVDAVVERADAAWSEHKGTDDRYDIAGVPARLRVIGADLTATVLPSLAPRRRPADRRPPALDLVALDAQVVGRPPPPPWDRAAYGPRDEVLGLGDVPVEITYSLLSAALGIRRVSDGRAVWWCDDGRRLPRWEAASPFRTIVLGALAGAGRHLVHAAAVEHGGRAALLSGPSGAGKSTSALACLDAGLGHLADDTAIVEPPTWLVHPAYGYAKLTEQAGAELVPHHAASAVNQERTSGEKLLVDLAGHLGDSSGRAVPLAVLLFPHVTGTSRPRLQRLPPVEAMRLLAPASVVPLSHGAGVTMAAAGDLVRAVPAWRLEIGPDLAAVAACVAAAIEAS
jgi:hypothetical protein